MFVDIAWWQVLAGVLLDLIAGSPRRMPHPLDAIRWLTSPLAALLRWTRLPAPTAGILLLLMTVSLFCAGVALTVPWLNIYWVWVMLTLRDLHLDHPDQAARHLNEGVTAPLFWLALGGPVAMAGFQAVGAVARFAGEDLGAPARTLHHLAGYLPGRISSGFLWVGASVLPLDARKLGYGLAALMVAIVCEVVG